MKPFRHLVFSKIAIGVMMLTSLLIMAGIAHAISKKSDNIASERAEPLIDITALCAEGDSLYSAGDTAAAYALLREGILNIADNNRKDTGVSAAGSDAANGVVTMQKLEEELESSKWHLRIAWIGLGISLGAIIAILIIWRRIGALKAREKDEKKRSEQLSRKLVATQIAMEETSQVLEDVSKAVGEMASEQKGKTSGTVIANTIKSHKVRATERESFIDSFTALHPEFALRLKGINGAITEPDIRIASYIVAGLDSKHIAATLGIRPESVKQARWRLRTKLGVAKGASLEETLRRLNTYT